MEKLISFRHTVAVLLLLALPRITLAQESPSTEASRELPAGPLKDEILKELAKIPIRGAVEGSREKRTETSLGDYSTQTNWEALIDGRFEKEKFKTELKLKVIDKKKADGIERVVVHACAPVAGKITCDIKTLGKTTVKFKATACLELVGTIREKDQIEVKPTGWTGGLPGLTLEPNNVAILEFMADKSFQPVRNVSNALNTNADGSPAKAAPAKAALDGGDLLLKVVATTRVD